MTDLFEKEMFSYSIEFFALIIWRSFIEKAPINLEGDWWICFAEKIPVGLMGFLYWIKNPDIIGGTSQWIK